MQPESGFTEGSVAYKSGKLIKIKALFKEDIITNIKITGDFFIYPEDSIELLEKNLKNKKLSEVKSIIERTLKNCEYIGIDPESLYMAVMEAWKKRK